MDHPRSLCLPLAAALLATFFATGPAAAQGASLPVDMQGTWGWDDEACAEHVSDGRVAVSSLIVEFFASAYVLEDPRADGDRWVSSATVHAEGEEGTEAGSITLRLVGRDELEIRTGDEAPSIYVRCADDLPVR